MMEGEWFGPNIWKKSHIIRDFIIGIIVVIIL